MSGEWVLPEERQADKKATYQTARTRILSASISKQPQSPQVKILPAKDIMQKSPSNLGQKNEKKNHQQRLQLINAHANIDNLKLILQSPNRPQPVILRQSNKTRN